MSDSLLRELRRDELPQLLTMLHALGQSEGVPKVATSLDHLEQALFSPQPAAWCLLLVEQGAVAGFLIYSWKWATFTGIAELYMQALYVDPTFRRRGLARAAMAGLAQIALARGCSRMEWLAVRDNAMSNGFYDACGAIRVEHMAVRRLTMPALAELAAEAYIEDMQ
ncbi:GNAT family N-acetyltransferase [Chitinimonas sp.]|uniref:GNAT family N-acetyltransferase n=1 Tax=Chitinimonas sp. TaxID=1934313 RepID=UPI002F93B341